VGGQLLGRARADEQTVCVQDLLSPAGPVTGAWEVEQPTLEELLLAYLRSPQAPALYADEARVGDSVVA
jgi:ABC-2 type transport system ATP-binding protein